MIDDENHAMDESFEDELEPVLNESAWDLVHQVLTVCEELRVDPVETESGAVVLDFGVEATGSLAAGLALAEVCMADLAEISLVPSEIDGIGWNRVAVQTDMPVESCLLSQYAGWAVSVGDYFGMGSGPMRAAYGSEPLFEKLGYQERAYGIVGVIESGQLPTDEVIRHLAQSCQVPPEAVALLVAPTASIAGNMQVVARSVETALHKLFELDFDMGRIISGCGDAPLSPVAGDDLTGIGRTNDAILYGGRVTLMVDGDDESLRAIGPKVPSSGSEAYGKPFLDIFEAAGRDFYKIDPHLFSPAEIIFHNIESGNVHRFGGMNLPVLKQSFGL